MKRANSNTKPTMGWVDEVVVLDTPTEDDPEGDVRRLMSYVGEAKDMTELYQRLDVHHYMTQRMWQRYEGRANTEFAKQWRQRLYGRKHPGRLKLMVTGVERALQMIKAEYRGDIPTLPVESIIHE